MSSILMWTLARCSYSNVSLKQLKHEGKAHWFHVGFYHIKHRSCWQISILVRVPNFFNVFIRCHIDVKVIFRLNSCDVQSNTPTLIKIFDLDNFPVLKAVDKINKESVCSWRDMEFILSEHFIRPNFPGSRYIPYPVNYT